MPSTPPADTESPDTRTKPDPVAQPEPDPEPPDARTEPAATGTEAASAVPGATTMTSEAEVSPAEPGPPAPAALDAKAAPATARLTRWARPLAPLRSLRPAVLFSVSIVLAVAGVFLLALTPASGKPVPPNQALVNPALTRQVTAALSAELTRIYSYDYTDLGATTGAARQVLAGQARTQYGELTRVLSGAVTEKLDVFTTVSSIGVESLTPDTVTALVFLKQRSTRAGKPAGTADGQLYVTARRSGARWLITTIAPR